MRAPGEVMAENRPSPVVGGRSSPLASSSPIKASSPSSQERKGMNRAQLTIEELQELAERQRKQILYSSKELMEKQQQLMRMHNDFRVRAKIQNGTDADTSTKAAPTSPRMKSRNPKMLNKREQDQYARMLRETYNNMGKLQNRNQVQRDTDIKRLNNAELAHELKKMRSIFSSKQNELAEAVKKVDILTHELEKRKNGDSGNSTVPTPERINRRKKIQAAKDELDRLRNELIVRNEMNSQQSHQLQLQRDIIHEKKQELRDLNSRINELANALLKQQSASSTRTMPNYAALNGYQQKFINANYLQDTLNRKRSTKSLLTQDINENNINSQYNKKEILPVNDLSPALNDKYKDINSPPINETSTGETHFSDPSLMRNQSWNEEKIQSLHIKPDIPKKASPPMNSPSSSVSSHSSMSSSSITAEDAHRAISSLNKAFSAPSPPPPPQRTTPVGVLIDRNESPQHYDNELISILQAPGQSGGSMKNETAVYSNQYSDCSLSATSDKLNGYSQYEEDLSNRQTYKSDDSKRKSHPPPIKPKPNLNTSNKAEHDSEMDERTRKDLEDIFNMNEINKMFSFDQDPESSPHVNVQAIRGDGRQADDNKSWPSPPEEETGPTEPEEFELSFADIDEINEIQTDMWSNSGSTLSNNESIDSDFEDISKAIVPIVISVSPDKMPPPILMKPEKCRKEKRNVVLDPFILLLDAALEGELETVKDVLRLVPDPSRPNPEGITALHNAVCGNHKEVVRYLVEVACDINAADNNGWTPLHCAAFYNDTELCEYLVEHGASVFATTYTDYQTPAHKCSRLDDNYDVCFAYLHECKENVGRFNNGLVHSLYDYSSENEDELSFACGELLTVLRRGDTVEKEWWWARSKNGETGYIPCNLIGNYPRIAAVV